MKSTSRLRMRKLRPLVFAGSLILHGVLVFLLVSPADAQQRSVSFGQPTSNSNVVRLSDNGDLQNLTTDQFANQEFYLESRVANLEAQIQSLQLNPTNRAGESGNGQPGFYFGAASVWAKPHYKEAFQFSQTNVVSGQQTLSPFQYDYDASPRIWAGIRNANGVGIRGTYWSFDANGQSSTNTADGINIFGAHAVTIIFPANIFAAIPGSTLQNDDSLETEITNLYVTYDSSVSGFNVSTGIGLRYARLLQTLSSVVSGPLPASLNWTRQYNGLGPSVSMDMSKRIGNSRFSGVAKGSGAFLFGTKKINRTVFGDQSPQPASPFLTLDEADEVVGIGDVGFGLEWAATMARGSKIAVRGTYEGQLWAEAGAPTLGFLGFEGFGLQAEFRR